MKKTAEKLLSATIRTLLVAALPAAALAAPGQGKAFGPGHPFELKDLPFGDFRSRLESLPAPARNRAMAWMHKFEFTDRDLPFMRVDQDGGILYADTFTPSEVDANAAGGTEAAPVAEATTAEQVFALHSRPGASKVIYLDFDGHLISGTAWSSSDLQARPYDTNGNDSVFNDAELANIAEIWRRVAEDYAPFDVDVTTEEPRSFGPTVARVLVTRNVDARGTAMPYSTAGGVAYMGVWGRSDYSSRYSPALVYYNNLGSGRADYVAEAASHEAGHNLSLSHDGTDTRSYYGGHGSGYVSWGPIMGTGYGRNVSQWSKGEYNGANNQQDDVGVLAGKLALRGDDHADFMSGATRIVFDASGNVVVTTPESDPGNQAGDNKGMIESANDLDVFYFDTAGGLVELDVQPAWQGRYTRGGNLDVQTGLYDAAGNLLQTGDSASDTNGMISAELVAGRYYLAVEGGGNAVSPYSDYGSLGQYFISGTLTVNVDDQPPAPNPMGWAMQPHALDRTSVSMTATTATDASGVVEYRFECVSGASGCVSSGWQASETYVAEGLEPGASYEYRVTARDAYANVTSGSAIASVTTYDNLAPTAFDDAAELQEGTQVTVNVLANDSDPDGDRLAVATVDPALNGTVINNGSNVTYTPDAGFVGTDSFSYTVSDGIGGRATANVSVNVAGGSQNQPPVANADRVSVNLGETITIDVVGNDRDPDGDALTITAVSAASKGSVLWQPGQNTITYVHGGKRKGGDSFTYEISDGQGGVASGTVAIAIQRIRKR